MNYTVAHDSGNVINPMIVDGQVQGGVAHGIGNALFEWMKYDDGAQPLTTTFQDYLLPASCDVPAPGSSTSRRRTRSTRSASRARAKAAPFPRRPRSSRRSRTRCRPFGVHFTDMPLTPERIVAALRKAGAYEKMVAA